MAIPYVVPRRSAKMDYSLPPTLFGIQGFEIQVSASKLLDVYSSAAERRNCEAK
jgi:hypothetical protein